MKRLAGKNSVQKQNCEKNMGLDRHFYYNEKLILEPAISSFDSLHIGESIAIFRSRY